MQGSAKLEVQHGSTDLPTSPDLSMPRQVDESDLSPPVLSPEKRASGYPTCRTRTAQMMNPMLITTLGTATAQDE